jgi:hypothetical protein
LRKTVNDLLLETEKVSKSEWVKAVKGGKKTLAEERYGNEVNF